MKTPEKIIYGLQKQYEKRYNVKIYEDLHIQGLYLKKLIKELRKTYLKNDLKQIAAGLRIFNEGNCYYLTEGFFNLLTDY